MTDEPICPECKQGKHYNCTGEMLVDLVTEDGEYAGDDWVECSCGAAGHD